MEGMDRPASCTQFMPLQWKCAFCISWVATTTFEGNNLLVLKWSRKRQWKKSNLNYRYMVSVWNASALSSGASTTPKAALQHASNAIATASSIHANPPMGNRHWIVPIVPSCSRTLTALHSISCSKDQMLEMDAPNVDSNRYAKCDASVDAAIE